MGIVRLLLGVIGWGLVIAGVLGMVLALARNVLRVPPSVPKWKAALLPTYSYPLYNRHITHGAVVFFVGALVLFLRSRM